MKDELTKEKLEEYVAMLKQGEIDVDELTSGLIAVHGATRIESEMTPMEFLDYLESISESSGIPLTMSDELRMELRVVQKQKEQMELVKYMLAGYADHPAPEHCPDCSTKLISSLTYPFEGEIYESGYCVECGAQVPEPKGDWSKQNPTPEDFYENLESIKKRRERMMGRRPWG